VLVKGLTNRTKEMILSERDRAAFSSLADFFLRVRPLPEEIESLIRVGAFDEFGKPRTAHYWEFKSLCASHSADSPHGRARLSSARRVVHQSQPGALRTDAPYLGDRVHGASVQSSVFDVQSSPSPRPSLPGAPAHSPTQSYLLPPASLDRLPSVPLSEPGRLQRLRAEEELLGYPVSGHPLELYPDIAWDTYCPINRLGNHVGEQIVTCGLVIEQRLFHQVTGEPMKFITIADWTGMVETELFDKTYKSYGLNTVRYRVLEITATVEPFENGRGFTLRVLRAGKPRHK